MLIFGKYATVALLAPLVLGQEFDQEDAAAMAWRAYGNFVTYFLASNAVPRNSRVYVTPVTLQGIAGGDPVPLANTNWEIWSVADSLQTVDSPYQRTGGNSYIANLDAYLRNVNVTVRIPTASELYVLQGLGVLVRAAERAMLDAELAALERWRLLTGGRNTSASFGWWVPSGWPAFYSSLEAYWNISQHYQNYYRQIYGDSNANLAQQMLDVAVARARRNFSPGINMRADPTDISIPETGPYVRAPEPPVENTVLVPHYSMTGLRDQCNAWLRSTDGQRTNFTFRMSRSEMTNWTSMGFTTPGRPIRGSLFGLIGGRASNTSQWEEFSQWNSTFESVVELTFSVQGAPVAFDVTPGLWDQGNVRSLYPRLLEGSEDTLAGQVRVTRLLMGYRPALKMTIRDVTIYRAVRNWWQTTISGSSPEIRIFGFSFGIGNTFEQRDVTEMTWTEIENNGGSFEIPPSNSRRPFILGAMGRVQ